jgi:hypothetical protein
MELHGVLNFFAPCLLADYYNLFLGMSLTLRSLDLVWSPNVYLNGFKSVRIL